MKQNENEINVTKPLGHIESSQIREINSSKCLQLKIRKNTNKWFNDATQKFGKNRTNPIKTQSMERNNKNQSRDQ